MKLVGQLLICALWFLFFYEVYKNENKNKNENKKNERIKDERIKDERIKDENQLDGENGIIYVSSNGLKKGAIVTAKIYGENPFQGTITSIKTLSVSPKNDAPVYRGFTEIKVTIKRQSEKYEIITFFYD